MIKAQRTDLLPSPLIYVSKKEIGAILKNDMDLIQTNIKTILKEKNKSQMDLARSIESDKQHVNYILRTGNSGITIKVLGRIAKALGVKTSDLLK